MTPLSVIVITRNEERNIIACLESAAWAGDIVIVDAESKDATLALSRRFTQKIFVEPWKSFSEAKEFAVSKTSHDWVLWLDADERVTPELASEIRTLLNSPPDHSAYSVARRAYFLGRWIRHSGWYPGRVTRLFRKDRASFSQAAVHEGLNIQGTTGRLRHDLLHFTDPNLFHYLAKFNRYTTLASKESFDGKKKFRPIDVVVRPPWSFIRMYFLRLGFLDGVPGLLLALLSSFYVFTKYAKLWETWNSEVA
ncbi:MAG TPA: glycosyltransferase family 2 protein [Bacteroidota bacterium]|nr:glycosyltransferase family 2 protein [Bacteroidota bacterium]